MKLKYFIIILTLLLLLPCLASSKNIKKQARIVGGKPAIPNEFPWVGALVYKGKRPYDAFCGASLVHPKWVMTAAHCMEGESTNSFEVVIGLNNLKTEKGHVRTVNQIIVHPDYDNYWLYSDIAMIELSEPVVDIQPVSLCYDYVKKSGKSLTVMGWGDLKENGSGSNVLMKVSIPIVSDSACKLTYPGEIDDGMFCAGLEIGGKDSCQGDSGGPAIVWMDNQWQLIGLVSWGNGCARAGFYGVYTRIQQFFSFVFASVIDDLSTKTISLEKGWNLVSLPFLLSNSYLDQIFPEATIAFRYSDSYLPANQLYPGKGYWIKMPEAKSYSIVGFESYMEIPSSYGWHLIGPTKNLLSINDPAIDSIIAFANDQYYSVNECPYNQACWVLIGNGCEKR